MVILQSFVPGSIQSSEVGQRDCQKAGYPCNLEFPASANAPPPGGSVLTDIVTAVHQCPAYSMLSRLAACRAAHYQDATNCSVMTPPHVLQGRQEKMFARYQSQTASASHIATRPISHFICCNPANRSCRILHLGTRRTSMMPVRSTRNRPTFQLSLFASRPSKSLTSKTHRSRHSFDIVLWPQY